jgi:tetratricopeptide (TPR) repeat protein
MPAVPAAAAPGPWWASARGAGALVAVVVALVFARSLGNGFTYDEPLVLVQAQTFLKTADFGALFSRDYFAASLEGTWRPFCTLTYMLDAMVAFSPATFKASSILWHVGTAWLVMALVRRLLPEGKGRFALVAGLIFAVHPVTTETVDNASFREDTLVTFWTLATLLLALSERPLRALVAFALGLLSKESAVVAPVLLAILRLGGPHAYRRPGRSVVRELAPFAVVLAVYLSIRFGPMSTAGQYAAYPGGTLAKTLAAMPLVWAHDLKLLVWPWPLLADYTGYFPFGRVTVGQVLPALAAVLGFVAAIAFAARRKQVTIAFGLGWFALALGPVSNFIPVPVPAAERFLMLPLVGIAIAAAAGAATLFERAPLERRRALLVAGVAVLIVYAALVNVRHEAWRDDEALWKDTVAVNPRACGAQSAVGGTLLSRGMEQRSPELLRDAAAHQRLALSQCSDASDEARAAIIYTRLGAAEAMLGDVPKARAALERALALRPAYALAVVWMGYVEYLSDDEDAAAKLLKHAIIDLGPPDSTVAAVARLYVDKL